MHGLKFDKNESQNDLVPKISECFSEIGLSYKEEEIDRVHCIGKPYKNKSLGLTMKTYHYQVQVMEMQAKCLPESTKEI